MFHVASSLVMARIRTLSLVSSRCGKASEEDEFSAASRLGGSGSRDNEEESLKSKDAGGYPCPQSIGMI